MLIAIAAFFTLLFYTLTPKATETKPEIENILKPFNREVIVILVGDTMLGRSVMTWSEKAKDYKYPFLKVADRLKEADIVFANLESPFVSNCPRTNTGMTFCADPKMVEGLISANIRVVTIANNHIGNYGQEGIDQSLDVLQKSKIDYVGQGNLVIKNIKGTKLGFLGFGYTAKKLAQTDLEQIKKADKEVDVLIVGVHWGDEYQAKPTDGEKLMTKSLIEAGADVIAGHHPHVVQPREEINGKPVYYSLGNFVFDQMWSEETKKGFGYKTYF